MSASRQSDISEELEVVVEYESPDVDGLGNGELEGGSGCDVRGTRRLDYAAIGGGAVLIALSFLCCGGQSAVASTAGRLQPRHIVSGLTQCCANIAEQGVQ